MVGRRGEAQGRHYTVDGMRLPAAARSAPRGSGLVAGFYGKPKPLRRAARYDRLLPVDLESPDQLTEIGADGAQLRREAGRQPEEPYDIVAALPTRHRPGAIRRAGCHLVGG